MYILVWYALVRDFNNTCRYNILLKLQVLGICIPLITQFYTILEVVDNIYLTFLTKSSLSTNSLKTIVSDAVFPSIFIFYYQSIVEVKHYF